MKQFLVSIIICRFTGHRLYLSETNRSVSCAGVEVTALTFPQSSSDCRVRVLTRFFLRLSKNVIESDLSSGCNKCMPDYHSPGGEGRGEEQIYDLASKKWVE